MMSRPARYSAAAAGSSGCAGCALAVWPARTAVSVMRDLPGLLVGDDRADPVAQAGVAPDQDDRVEDEHHDEAHGDPREPIVRLGLQRLEQVVDGDGDHDYGEDRQHD